ncbi:mitochondrial carrier domain-containing protein [Dissophora ornata]|nr:mitochondrial carrier domain-containing protein [Dissophora ornata]
MSTPTLNTSTSQDAGSIQPSPAQRMISACAGSLLTSLLVTPLDVVKTRLQSQTVVATPTCAVPFTYTNNASAYEKLCTCCREVFYAPEQPHSHSHTGPAGSGPGSATAAIRQNIANVLAGAAQERYFHGTWDGVKKIVRYEGATSLWRGLSPTVAMSIPATVIYFVGYDYLKVVLSEKARMLSPESGGILFGQTSFVYECRDTLAPLVAGGFARTVAATVISPLELFRTRMQSVHTDTKGNSGLFRGVSQGIVAMVRSEGVLSLWRGLGPTLWRDVPFSAIYWMGYEDIKKRIISWDLGNHPQKPVLNEFEIAFASGALSGMVAATLTTPFDVAKTRRQVDLMQPVHTKIISLMRAIVQEEGYRGLWRGLTARVAKVAPSCAIMISSYEIGKKALSEQWWGLGSSGSSGSTGSEVAAGSGGSGFRGTANAEDRLVLMRAATAAGVGAASSAV